MSIVIGTAIGSGIFLVPSDMIKGGGVARDGVRGVDFGAC
jgi:hypothetical protein